MQSLTPGPLWHQGLPATCQSLLITTKCWHPVPNDNTCRVSPSVQLVEFLKHEFDFIRRLSTCHARRTGHLAFAFFTAHHGAFKLNLWPPHPILVSCKNMSVFWHTRMTEKMQTHYGWTDVGSTLASAPHAQSCVLQSCAEAWPVFSACAPSSSLLLGTFPTSMGGSSVVAQQEEQVGREKWQFLSPILFQPPQVGRHQCCGNTSGCRDKLRHNPGLRLPRVW